MNILGYILRRAARHWQVLLTLVLGVLLATALLASSPVLVDSVVEFGLRRRLLAAEPLAGNLRLRATGAPDEATFAALDLRVNEILARHLGPYLEAVIPTIGSRWLFPWLDNAPQTDQRVQFRFYGRGDTDVAGRVTVVAGDWPAQAMPSAPSPPAAEDGTAPADRLVAGVIGSEMADFYGLGVGDRLPLSIKQSAAAPDIWVEISGIVQPVAPQDRYWFGEYGPLRSLSDQRWQVQYAVILPYADAFPVMATMLPDSRHELAWHVVPAPASIGSGDIRTIRARLMLVRAALGDLTPTVTVETDLDALLADFASQSTAVRAPLTFLTAEVVLLMLYYVIMVSALAVRQVEREFAILQSRGASAAQIFRIQVGEAALIGAVALVTGPFLGVLLVRGLVLVGPLADVTEPGWQLTLPLAAWLAAGVGTVAALTGLLLPARSAIRRSIVAYQQSATRVSTPPLWQRAYLDVFALALGLVLLWRLQYYGSIVGGGGSQQQVDWLLLLSPIALLVGSGTILLRVFPLLLRFLAFVARRGRGLPAALAMWQAARNPAHVARLVLLLTLAMSLGILSTGINATLDASEAERARYTAGGEVRLVSRRALPLSQLGALEAVEAATGVWRTQGSISGGRGFRRFDLLAIEPYTFAAVTRYRADFAQRHMGTLLGDLVLDEATSPGLVSLPGEPAEVGVWLWSAPDPAPDARDFRPELEGDSNLDRIGVEAKVQTAQGEILTLTLLPIPGVAPATPGWRYFGAELAPMTPENYPLGLHSVWIRNRARTAGAFSRNIATGMSLAIDALTVRSGGGREIVDELETLTQIWQLDDPNSVVTFDFINAYSGRASQSLTLRFDDPLQVVSLQRVAEQVSIQPLPALASQEFLASLETAVGEQVNVIVNSQSIPVQLVGQVRYFPTMYADEEAGYLVTNRDALLGMLNAITNRSTNVNEVLLEVTAGTAAPAVSAAALKQVPAIYRSWDVETVRKTMKADPMALGLRSVTYFGYVLTTALSLVGFATYFYMNARQKEAVYGVLRSIGMSPRQLYGTLVLEQVVLILAGLAIGTVLGMVLNQITLPGLPITFGDRPPTPPFIARNDWLAVGRIYLTLAVAFFVTLGAATMLLWRTQLHRVLRVGEE